MADDTPKKKPAPRPDEASQEFFAGAAEGRLMVNRCPACGALSWPNARYAGELSICPSCWAPGLEWAPVSGKGTVYALGFMHQRYDPAFAADLPYNLAIVELDEGIRTQHVPLV